MSQLLQSPEQWAEEDMRVHRTATDKASEQRVGIFLAVARVLKKWPEPPAGAENPHRISRADFDAGMSEARRC